MTRYVSDKKERSAEPHPIWRGIGLIMIIVIPILSFAVADQLMIYFAENNILIIEQLVRPPVEVPLWGAVYNWPAMLIFTFIIAIILFGIFALVNAVIYGASSEKTLQKLEAPPKQYKKKRKLIKPDYD